MTAIAHESGRSYAIVDQVIMDTPPVQGPAPKLGRERKVAKHPLWPRQQAPRGRPMRSGVRGERPEPIRSTIDIASVVDFGGAIRQQRRAMGLVADDASVLVDMWASNLVLLERGKKDVKLTTMLRLLDGLGLKLAIVPK